MLRFINVCVYRIDFYFTRKKLNSDSSNSFFVMSESKPLLSLRKGYSMNIYAIIILSALLLDFGIELLSNILNLKTISEELPEEFKDVYDAKTYHKSQDYTRVKTIFGLFTSIFSLVVILIFWFAGGFNFFDTIVRSWNFSPIYTGLIYIGILLLLIEIMILPFIIVNTFVIEERFGFNKTTPTTFITDLLKSLVLSVLLGGPLLAGVLAFFQYTGAYAWLYCWIVTIFFFLFVQFIAPSLILPIFIKFKPLEEGELKESIMMYIRTVNFSIADIFIVDGSRRSTKSNAFFAGFGKNKRIALFDTLVEKHSIPEIVAILAHEIGHYKKMHIIQSMIISILHTGVLFFLLSLFIRNEKLFDAFYVEKISVYVGFILFGMLYKPIELFLSFFINMLSRNNEFQADRFASETIENPEIMVNALKGLSVDNLINLRPHALDVFLNYSYPPVLERIKAIRNIKIHVI